jgi:hypothetical protein
MDLDAAKVSDQNTPQWARIGMLVCFAVAIGILSMSIWFQSARATGGGTSPSSYHPA